MVKQTLLSTHKAPNSESWKGFHVVQIVEENIVKNVFHQKHYKTIDIWDLFD